MDRTVNAWGPGLRILVYDIDPERIETGADAIAVIGAPDFESREVGIGPSRFQSVGMAVDGPDQRLFVADSGNNRVLVFDIRPEVLEDDPAAFAVIGQSDFESRESGTTARLFSRPSGLALDRVNHRLFVGDGGNNRILVFDVHPERFASNPEAVAVLGQPDFVSRNPRQSNTQIGPGSMSYDEATGRLLITDGGRNRILVYDVAPERLTNFPQPIGVIGQPDYETVTPDVLTYDPEYARSKTLSPRVGGESISAENQLLYVSEGYPAGNRIAIFDISGEGDSLSGGNMVDVIGHIDDEGNPEFTGRAANDRVDDRTHYPRAVALDPVDHRLFTIDQYNHRVLVWQLDPNNQLLDRKAIAVIGQPDFRSAILPPPTSRTFRLPSAVAYDTGQKLLFVGDGWHNRVMVFDADPARLATYPEAIAVLGQPDFTTVNSEMTQTSLNFDVAVGRHGITSSSPRAMGIAADAEGQRLFVSVGPNYRVMVFDISPGNLRNGAPAFAVIGKPDFTSGRTVLNERNGGGGQGPATRNTFSSMPGDLVFDAAHQRLFVIDGRSHRVLVFNVAPANLSNGMDAMAVIGQPDFESIETIRLDTDVVSESTGRSRLRWPDGIAYDTENERLILSDKGNDRILVFDVAPDQLENGMEASFVLGQKDFVSRNPGRGRQDQLMDVRGLAFDSQHQRLFATDSFWARVMVFDFARSERDVSLARFGTQTYSTIDAAIDEDQPQQFGYAELSLPVASAAVYSVTQNLLDQASMRESRLLVSEVAVPAAAPAVRTDFFGQHDDVRETLFLLGNPSNQIAELTFTFRDSEGQLRDTAQSTLAAGEQRRVSSRELLGNGDTLEGLVSVESSAPVAVAALALTRNARREQILSAAPRISEAVQSDSTPIVVPQVRNGAGYRTRIRLVNPSDQTLEGSIEFLDPSGQTVSTPEVSFEVSPWGTYEHVTDGQSVIARNGFAIVTPVGPAPRVTATTELSDGDTLLSESRVETSQPIQRAWIPLNTMTTPTRHGEIEASVTIVNNNPVGAALRFGLYGMDGTEIDRYELIVREESQREFSLVQLFNVGQFKGTLHIFSDAPVSIHAGQETLNLRGESVAMQLPVFEASDMGENTMLAITDGDGFATELVMVNTGGAEVAGRVSLRTAEGAPSSLPLR